ncbi:MAG TPA: hypothetical protein VFQ61_25845 [Polyangiaceae bacterium]|nr:hypothetical protein [Polyangiaceae bacterium]
MTARESHPEGLIDRARRGAATEPELCALAEHLALCPSCRFESALRSDADRAGLPRVSDELLIARLRRSTTRALVARGARPRRAHRARAVWLVAAALCVGSASLAGVLGYRVVSRASSAPPMASPGAVEKNPPRFAGRSALPSSSSLPAPADVEVVAPVEAAVPVGSIPSTASSGPPPAKRSAAELFAEANRARRAGDIAQAARGYRELTQRFPASSEAAVARVSFGRLLLDRLGNAKGALAEFEGYLNNAGHRALREEALIGRAVALGRLGRVKDERTAWQTLLRSFPSSTYATRAGARLGELDARAAAP